MDGTVAGNVNDESVGQCKLNPNGCGQTVSHSAKAAGSDKSARFGYGQELRGPHLVLTYFRGIHGLAFSNALHCLDHLLGFESVCILAVGKGAGVMPLPQLINPLRMGSGPVMRMFRIAGPEHFMQTVQRHGAIAHHRHIYFHIFANGRGIDINMNNFRFGREGGQPARDAVIETRPGGNNEVSLVHCFIGSVGAMHAQHAKEQGVISRKSPQAHER